MDIGGHNTNNTVGQASLIQLGTVATTHTGDADMGKNFGKILTIGIAIFNPAAALGLSGFAATAFNFIATQAVGALFGGDDMGGGGGRGVNDAGLLLNSTGSNKSVEVVYGDRRIGGTRVYIDTTDNNGVPGDDKNEYLHLAIAICQGGVRTDNLDTIKSIDKILFNDKTAWTASGGIESDFSGLMDLRLYYGKGGSDTAQDVASPDVTANSIDTQNGILDVSDDWTSAHRMNGVAYAYLILKYDREKFPGLPTILFDVKGKGVDNGSGFTKTDADRKNPAYVLRDYLQSSRYGKGLTDAELDLTSFGTAATYCSNAGLEFNGAVLTSNTIFQNVQQILAAGNLNLVFSAGKYRVAPQKKLDHTSAFDFNTENIIGQWQISLGSKRSMYNTVTVNFFNKDTDYQPDSVVIEPSEYLTADSNVVNAKTMDLPYTDNATDAERLARFYLDTSRYQTVVNFKATWEALKLDVGDPCTITHSVPGWDGKEFVVNSMVLLDDSTVDVTLVQYLPETIGSRTDVYLEDNV